MKCKDCGVEETRHLWYGDAWWQCPKCYWMHRERKDEEK